MTKLVVLAAILLAFTACDNHSEPEADISTEQAVEIVAASLATDAKGLTAQIEDSAEDAMEFTNESDSLNGGRTVETASCGIDSTATFDLESLQGGRVTFDYAFSYSYGLSCNQFLIPTTLDFAFTQSGSAEAARYSSNTSSGGTWTLQGLQISSTTYDLSGSYERSGSHNSRVFDQNSYDFDLDINLTGLTIDKGNYMILSGSGDFSIVGTSTLEGDGFSINGSITYAGNNQVVVTIRDETYIIDLQTGEIFS